MDPVQECVQQVNESVQKLRSLIYGCSTSSLVRWCFAFNLQRINNPEFETRLSSPVKQCSFLLGLLLESKEPETPKDFIKEGWRQAEDLLESAFQAYLPLYFPSEGELEFKTAEWHQIREVAMVSFLHFFNNGPLASVEQIKSRMQRYITPFDEYLLKKVGINATQAVKICDWIANKSKKDLHDLSPLLRAEWVSRHMLLKEAEAKNWSSKDLRHAAGTAGYQEALVKLITSLDQSGKILYSDLKANFSEIGEQFWKLFSIGRGEGPTLNYPTERNIADERPLIRISEAEAICPVMNILYIAILLWGEEVLSSGERRENFFRTRDNALEKETIDHFRRLLGTHANFYSKVFETEDCRNEHDLIIVGKELCLIVEDKASPPIEPFRDPEKAFVRLRDNFRDNKGPQKAYDQAMRIFRRLINGESVKLFDGKGHMVTELSPELVSRTFCICVTRDNYGPLATDLALLLEKEDTDPYPWMVNVFDLEGLGEVWNYFRWGTCELREYMEQRILLHGKAFSDDELDFAGYYVRHGNFDQALAQPGLISLDPTYSSVFDEIYKHLHCGGPRVELKRTFPYMADIRNSLIAGTPVFVDSPEKPKKRKTGRNEPCPCGSGRKHKKCCGY